MVPEIPESYFEEETREGFTISGKVKHSWAAQLKIVSLFAEVCARHGLRWFAEYGTLLGTVRHRGYIPWDDDLDICMPREDYERVWPFLAQELPAYFHICSRQADPHINSPWGSIRNRREIDLGGRDPREAEITKEFYGWPYVAGVDVFPLDHIPADESERDIQQVWYRSIHDILRNYAAYEEQGAIGEAAATLGEAMGVDLPDTPDGFKVALWELDRAVAGMYPREESIGVTSLYWRVYGHVRIRPHACYDDTIWLPFEMIELPVPVGYEEILTLEFGDWNAPRKGTQGHGYPYFAAQEKRAEIILEADRLEAQGEYAAERAFLEQALERLSDSWEVYLMLARASQREDLPYAVQCLQKALSLCPDEAVRQNIRSNLMSLTQGNS